MSSLLSSPRVTVYVGDGFKFLADNEGTYDVIITDSSDPVGPAESLFQKPYFKLLHDALAPGGHVSTQAECLWIHLPLICELKTMTAGLFPVAEYAYTTIPTYPSGQIGFMVCSKDAGRDLKTPVKGRDLKGCRYYNEQMHKSAFILPEFGRAMLEEGKNVLPVFGRAALAVAAGKPKKKVLLLGSGFVARPCAEYIVRDPSNELTIGTSLSLISLIQIIYLCLHSLSYAQELSNSRIGSSQRHGHCLGCQLPCRPRCPNRLTRPGHLLNPLHIPRNCDQVCHQKQDSCRHHQLRLPRYEGA
jgi:hypothetical protein